MQFLKRFFNFYLDASIHVAFAVVSLYGVSLRLLDIPGNIVLVGFIFCSTIVCYNFIKYGVEAEKYLIVKNSYHRCIQIFSFLAFLGAVYFLLKLGRFAVVVVVLLTLLSLLYAMPLVSKAKSLRSAAGLKVAIVAFEWVGFTVLLPIVAYTLPFSYDMLVVALQHFVLVVALMVPFEIRDLKYDSEDLRTIPQLLGIQKAKVLGSVLTTVFFLLLFFKDAPKPFEIGATLITAVTLVFFLWGTKKEQSKYYTAFWVESIPVLWWGLFWASGSQF
ncbi:MAG: hypothetical protein AAGB24_09015 [Bacteroidota bacterium]